ncbi:MAG TPA: hypothetical protein GXZ30_07600 [Propionibacterium sp.]|nr:hypothetical protein [Propionibacterium sp.]
MNLLDAAFGHDPQVLGSVLLAALIESPQIQPQVVSDLFVAEVDHPVLLDHAMLGRL